MPFCLPLALGRQPRDAGFFAAVASVSIGRGTDKGLSSSHALCRGWAPENTRRSLCDAPTAGCFSCLPVSPSLWTLSRSGRKSGEREQPEACPDVCHRILTFSLRYFYLK